MVFIKFKTKKQVVYNQSNLVQDLNVKVTKAEISNKTILLLVALLGTSLTSTLWFTGIQGPVFKDFICWSLYKDKLLSEYIKDYDVVSCYYNLPDPRVANSSQLMPANIHPHLCTHINIAFAQIKNKQIYLEDSQYESLRDLVKIKKHNPNLKILLSVGGAGSHDGFSEMVVNHAARKTFIRSIKSILKNFSLDGIDLDWEFPAIKLYQNKLRKRERQHFSQLLREIKAEYIREKKDYLLTVAVAAPQIIVDAAYDVDQINMYTDYVNIMTYDFHSYTKFTPFTGLNSPLYVRPGEELYFATLNINYTVQMYKDKGLDPKKIVIGIPTYGHSFTLVNTNNTKVGSPASGFGTLGNLGFVNYPDICVYLRKYENKTVVKEDNHAQVPYLYNEFEWVSFDNTESVIAKAKYIKDNKLRGAMIYSLNADDYNGVCEQLSGQVKFPLSISVKNALNNKQAQSETYCMT